MSDRDARLAELWLAFQEGKIAPDAWQRLLADEEGLRRYVRRAREREMREQAKEFHRATGRR